MSKGGRLILFVVIVEIVIIGICILRAATGQREKDITAVVLRESEKDEKAEPEPVMPGTAAESAEVRTEGQTPDQEADTADQTDAASSGREGEAPAEQTAEPSVRIRLTTSDYGSEYHDSVTITCDGTFQFQTGEKAQIFTGGQTVVIGREHPFFTEGSIRVCAEGCLLRIDSIAHRNQVNTYPGVLDLYLTDQGIVIVNELGLEEYVERVVPSEMPASYGAQAACLQAVCARTYAYQKLISGQTDAYGAIANDSSEYQVYNASLAKDVSSQATAETYGTVLMYQGQPLVPYYFSTSCGFSTDNTVWSGSRLPYLRTQNLSYRQDIDLQTESVFRSFILDWDYPAYEDDCTWYRWNYTISVENLRTLLTGRMTALLAESPDSFRAESSDGSECAVEPSALEHLQEITVTQRLTGGMAGEAAFDCGSCTVFAKKEMILRRLLGSPDRMYCNQSSEGVGKSEGNYLPSAFFCVIANGEAESPESYSICGGGNGHGVGLSQNAANAMLQSGLTWSEVLQFFYLGTSLVQAY